LTAAITGGLMAALTASAGGLAGSLPAIAALTMSLAAAGLTYGWLVDDGRMREGFGPGILFWSAAFPAARLAQEIALGAGSREGLPAFLIYQALVGGAFGLGFLLLHNQVRAVLHYTGSRARRRSLQTPWGGDTRNDNN
jgi:hypothetical protein